MRRTALRSITGVLIAALILDPTTAAAFAIPRAQSAEGATSYSQRFDNQALVLAIVTASHPLIFESIHHAFSAVAHAAQTHKPLLAALGIMLGPVAMVLNGRFSSHPSDADEPSSPEEARGRAVRLIEALIRSTHEARESADPNTIAQLAALAVWEQEHDFHRSASAIVQRVWESWMENPQPWILGFLREWSHQETKLTNSDRRWCISSILDHAAAIAESEQSDEFRELLVQLKENREDRVIRLALHHLRQAVILEIAESDPSRAYQLASEYNPELIERNPSKGTEERVDSILSRVQSKDWLLQLLKDLAEKNPAALVENVLLMLHQVVHDQHLYNQIRALLTRDVLIAEPVVDVVIDDLVNTGVHLDRMSGIDKRDPVLRALRDRKAALLAIIRRLPVAVRESRGRHALDLIDEERQFLEDALHLPSEARTVVSREHVESVTRQLIDRLDNWHARVDDLDREPLVASLALLAAAWDLRADTPNLVMHSVWTNANMGSPWVRSFFEKASDEIGRWPVAFFLIQTQLSEGAYRPLPPWGIEYLRDTGIHQRTLVSDAIRGAEKGSDLVQAAEWLRWLIYRYADRLIADLNAQRDIAADLEKLVILAAKWNTQGILQKVWEDTRIRSEPWVAAFYEALAENLGLVEPVGLFFIHRQTEMTPPLPGWVKNVLMTLGKKHPKAMLNIFIHGARDVLTELGKLPNTDEIKLADFRRKLDSLRTLVLNLSTYFHNDLDYPSVAIERHLIDRMDPFKPGASSLSSVHVHHQIHYVGTFPRALDGDILDWVQQLVMEIARQGTAERTSILQILERRNGRFKHLYEAVLKIPVQDIDESNGDPTLMMALIGLAWTIPLWTRNSLLGGVMLAWLLLQIRHRDIWKEAATALRSAA